MIVIGCGLQAAQQLCGFNTLMYYSASIFAALGFKNATAVGCMIAMVNFAFTLVALRVSCQILTCSCQAHGRSSIRLAADAQCSTPYHGWCSPCFSPRSSSTVSLARHADT